MKILSAPFITIMVFTASAITAAVGCELFDLLEQKGWIAIVPIILFLAVWTIVYRILSNSGKP